MHLLALKRISGKRPKGTTFDASEIAGRFLVAKGLARRVPAPAPSARDWHHAVDDTPVEASDVEPTALEALGDPVGVTSHPRRGRGRRSAESPA